MSMNVVVLLYLVASVFFIQALKGLSHPTTSITGNRFGMVGMAIAMVTTAALIFKLAGESALGLSYVLGGLVVGGGIGAVMAKRVEMTKMPELVAFMHSMIGLAAVFIAIACVAEPWAFNIVAKGQPIPTGNRLELFIGSFVGAITFSGSVIAFGKLSGKYKFRLFQGAPVVFSGQHMLNLLLGVAMLGFGLWFVAGNLVRDLAALCDMAMLPWDVWGAMPQPDEAIDAGRLQLLDRLAMLTQAPDTHHLELRRAFADARLRVPAVVFNSVRGRMEPV